MNKNKKKVMAALIFTLIFCLFGSMNVCAAEPIPSLNPDEPCSLDLFIFYEDGENKEIPVSDVDIAIYRVAELRVAHGSPEYTLLKDFEDLKIDFDGMKAAESQTAAVRLAKQTEASGVMGKMKKTDTSGHVLFENLETGMYLVVREPSKKADNFEMSPFLVSVPMARVDVGGWDYSVEARPKLGSGNTPTPTPEKPLTPEKGSSSKTSVKTGDTTPVAFWIVFAAVSLAVIILTGSVLFKMRKKK
ncbi:hypothetical protein [Frisingicoccus sp.]|uniref:hypothetical protein n=1 Tax=Frisingicoccus sp. TaxID=1918627 RepID=UPI002E77F5C3|nr:hypothetical protein [Frisingicoccus sp.]MEE0752888.1 hypothetical protein [Frisingicoccus sp.]